MRRSEILRTRPNLHSRKAGRTRNQRSGCGDRRLTCIDPFRAHMQKCMVVNHRTMKLLVHRFEEILIGLGILHLVEQEFHGVDCAHLHQDTAQYPHFGQFVLLDKQFFLAGA